MATPNKPQVQNNAHVSTTFVEQTANETLGTEAKKLYYLIVRVGDKQEIINVGEKTHNKIKALTTVTNIKIDETKGGK